MKIAVTGAGGYIGRAVVRTAGVEGTSFIAFSRKPGPAQTCGVQWATVSGGPPDPSQLEGCDSLIHLAGITPSALPLDGDLSDFDRVNKTLALETARAACQAGVRHFVFASSMAVHGTWSRDVVTESSEISLSSPYSRSKWHAEEELRSFVENKPMGLTVVRPPMVYGPDCTGNFLRLISLAKRELPLPFSSLKAERSFMYVDNLASALLACAEGGSEIRTFVVEDGSRWSVPALYGQIADALNLRNRLFRCPVELLQMAGRVLGKSREVDSLTRPMIVDSSHMRSVLGWIPPVNRANAFVCTMNSFRS